MIANFLGELVAYWRDPKDKWVKTAVYIGIIAHISVLVSVNTGLWDEYFFRTTNNKLIQACDFFAIYIAGHEMLAGNTIYSTMDDNPGYLDIVPYYYPFRYLPVSALVGVALNAFEPWTAYKLWLILSEILFLGCIVAFGFYFRTMRQLHIAVALYLLYVPFYAELFLGQFNLLQSVLILGMILAAANGSWLNTQSWWTASVMWKINTIICLPAMLRWRQWKPLLWLTLLLILTCGPYFVLHPEDITRFVFTNVRIPGRLDLAQMGINFRFADIESAGNISVQGLLAKMTMHHIWGQDMEFSPAFNLVSWAIFLIIGILATIFARADRFAECLCLWVCMFFMVYTNIWEYHYLMLLPVIVFIMLKYPGIWPLLSWLCITIPPRHLGYAQILPDWDIPFIRPIGAVILFGYCIYLTVWKRETASESASDTNPGSSAIIKAGERSFAFREGG